MKLLNYQARVTEIGDVANRLAELYKKATHLQEETFLKASFMALEEQGKAITEAVKKHKAVSQLDDADAKRDQAIRVLDKLLKGYENIPVDSLKLHGERLSAIFKKYGVKIVDENYSSESNLIDSLLLDFSASEVQASITALAGVSEAIANIRKAQEEFAKIRAEYEKALSQNDKSETASHLRKPLLELLNKKIIPYLIAMQIANPEQYSAFANEISQVIEGVNEAIKARTKKKETKKETKEEIPSSNEMN